MAGSSWASVSPYDSSYKDCSQGLCSIYCPQWCYIIFPPPPPFFDPDDDDDGASDHGSGADFSPLIIAVIGILASAFILLSYYTIIAKYCRRRRSANDNVGRGATDADDDDNAHQTRPSDSSFQPPSESEGLEEGLIKSIRVYKYKKSEGFVEGTDCSVCLSEFEENEKLRLLPKCNHAFHVPCIDTWLKSHSSCPLCRSNIAPFLFDGMPQTQREVIMSNGGGGGGGGRVAANAMEYQSRSNESVVVVLVEDNVEVGVREEEVFGVVGNLPKTTPTGGILETNNQFGDHGEVDQINQPIRRSVSLNSPTFCSQDRLSVADILRDCSDDDDDDDDYDEDLVIQMENGFQLCMGIGTSSKGGADHDLISQEHHCKSDRSGALGLLRSPLAMKRSISTGRFVFTRYGKGKNSVIPN
ncbi:hypothetical protein TIFTF001_030650 [Ficus carica]|uniref:RING-type E3 ubiquitin transferase n=1 Tax=Ficus carica TaxID=3494 RepID=A0AA88DTN2_FICCA|nr:hypothetical protein TIFTF001_030650 [Ficus carica]